jgi:hypothetical protein
MPHVSAHAYTQPNSPMRMAMNGLRVNKARTTSTTSATHSHTGSVDVSTTHNASTAGTLLLRRENARASLMTTPALSMPRMAHMSQAWATYQASATSRPWRTSWVGA